MWTSYLALLVLGLSGFVFGFQLPDKNGEMQCQTPEGLEGTCEKITHCKTHTKHIMKQLNKETSKLFRYFT
jgi:hypothetical protein